MTESDTKETQPNSYIQLRHELDKLTHSLRLVSDAKRSIDIRSHLLHRPIFADFEFVAQLRQFCQNSRYQKVRILLNQTQDMVQNGHRLLDLAQRLPSFIEIRLCHKDFIDPRQEFIVVDQTAYLRWLFDNEIKAVVDSHDRGHSKQLTHEFNKLWQYANPASELRRLGI